MLANHPGQPLKDKGMPSLLGAWAQKALLAVLLSSA